MKKITVKGMLRVYQKNTRLHVDSNGNAWSNVSKDQYRAIAGRITDAKLGEIQREAAATVREFLGAAA